MSHLTIQALHFLAVIGRSSGNYIFQRIHKAKHEVCHFMDIFYTVSPLRKLADPSNGMDRSCEATIYPVLDKPITTRILGAQRPQTTGDISARFSGSLYD